MSREPPGWTTSPFPTTSAPLAHQTGEHAHQLDDGKASRPNFTFPSLHVRLSESWSPDGRRREHSRPDWSQVPRLAMLTRPTQWVLCSCRASARASQPDLTVFILRSARLTRSTQWVLGSRRASATVLATHLMFRPTGGEAQPSVAAGLVRLPNTVQLSLLSSHLFPRLARLTRSMSWVSISHRSLREPNQFRVFSSPYSPARLSVWHRSLDLVSDVDAGLPVGSYACRPQVRLIHSMPWVLISRRMSREPPCQTSQTLFICKPIGPTRPMTEYCALVGGFMGSLGQTPPCVLWLAGADGQ